MSYITIYRSYKNTMKNKNDRLWNERVNKTVKHFYIFWIKTEMSGERTGTLDMCLPCIKIFQHFVFVFSISCSCWFSLGNPMFYRVYINVNQARNHGIVYDKKIGACRTRSLVSFQTLRGMSSASFEGLEVVWFQNCHHHQKHHSQ